MGKPMTIPLDMGSEWVSGDAGSQPQGTTRLLQNMLPRPNRFPSRPPFVYDDQMYVNGLANFIDLANDATRLLAVNTSQQLFTKSATAGAETWAGPNATLVGGSRSTSYANYRGKTYAMLDDGTGLPFSAFVYDGATLSTSPFTSSIVARCAVIFDDRLFLSYPRVTVDNLAFNTVDDAYGYTTSTVNVTSSKTTDPDGTITYTQLPSSTAASGSFALIYSGGFAGSVPVTTDTPCVFRCNLRNRNYGVAVPISLAITVGGGIGRNRLYPLGALAATAGAGGYADGTMPLYKCTTSGTTAGVAPTFNTTVGSTTTDGGVVWTCVNANSTIGLQELTLPGDSTWYTFYVAGTVPGGTGTATDNTALGVDTFIRYYNSTSPSLSSAQLVSIDVGYRDGKTDGSPLKQNYGQQFTRGEFYYPFFNQESNRTAVIDLEEEMWSEIGTPSQIIASSTYKLREVSGFPTNACVIGNRKLTFKRSAFWQFQDTGDPDIPIRRERLNTVVGCIGPLALDTWNDTAFIIGEYEIFSYTVGGTPTPLCGEGMREEIMGRGSTWVESQSVYNRPILRIDQSKLIMWVYTQKGKLYAYDLRTQAWSTHTLDIDLEIDAMEWNRNTGNFYVSFGGHGLTRMDYTALSEDTIDDTATLHPVTCRVTFRPVELYTPPRYDYSLQQVRFMHGTTEDQTGQTTTASYSFDQGKTFVKSTVVTLDPLSTNGEFVPLRFPCRQGRATITVDLQHTGKTGEVANSDGTVQSEWSLSPRAYADVIVRREERVQSNPTQGASNL